PEIDGRSFFEILRRAGDFADTKAEMNALCQHLIVEHKVVGVLKQRQLGEDIAAKGAVAGVILRKLDSEKEVLEGGQQAIRDVLVKGHAAAEGVASDDARAEHHIVNAVRNHADHGGDEQRRVL